MAGDAPGLSVVTPAYDEAESLPALYARLRALAMGMVWEWIVVDDHSTDGTFEVVAALARSDVRVRGIRLARRSGAHAAIKCGLLEARGRGVALLAADLQDPPEVLIPLTAQWQAGTPVVWAVRGGREGDAVSAVRWSWLYQRLLRTLGGVHGLPAEGAGFFLIDRRVVEAVRCAQHPAADVLALIGSLGYAHAAVMYDRPVRVHGTSRWTLRRKIIFALQSLVSLSPLARLRPPADCPIEARVEDLAGGNRVHGCQ